MNSSLLRKSIAEAIGTFAILFFGCGSIRMAEQFPGSLPLFCIPFIFGLAVMVMIYAVGHLSGAHFNPAVTLAFAVARHFPNREVLPYWIAQFLGAIGGIALLSFLLPSSPMLGMTLPHVPLFQALIWEMILTFFLMFIIVSVATDTRAVGMMAGLAIGATVTLGAFIGGPVTGGSMNPARSFAPTLFAGRWDHFWIYLVGPSLGAILAALVYRWIRCESNSPSDQTHSQEAKGCC